MKPPFLPKKAPLMLGGGVFLDFSRPLVMTIVNCTPDSFYSESRCPGAEDALSAALKAEEEGADIVDFGAESTRPGAAPVPEETEMARLVPAIRAFRARSALPVSVDTRRAVVARAALDEGADIINDISALSDPAMAVLCAERGAAVVLMHTRASHFGKEWGIAGWNADKTRPAEKAAEITTERGAAPGLEAGRFRGKPQTEFQADMPTSILKEVRAFLEAAADRAVAAGVAREKIILDPGIGFGKSLTENLALVSRLAQTTPPDYPVLVGLSRKRFIGDLTGREPAGRLAGTVAACYAALEAGADILRVHDTAAARDLCAVFAALAR